MMLALALPPLVMIASGVALASLGMVLAFLVLRSRRRRFIALHGPTFHRLCDGLNISRFDRWRLSRLASKAGLLTPAVLLISRGAFDNALVRAAIHPNSRWPSTFRQRIFEAESNETSA